AQYAAKDPRIKLFKLDKNSGAGVARNNSIEQAQGRYIAFLDSDDLWFPNKLKQQIEFMQQANTEVCYSSYVELDDDSGAKRIIVAPKMLTLRDMIQNDYMGFLTVIYDTANLGKVYMPKLRKRQDWALKLLLMQHVDRAVGVIEPLAYYRVRANSLSNSKLGLVKYNIKVYSEVLGYSMIKSCFILLVIFLPNYFYKKKLTQLINR
ncbi:MAG: glycosyltransferase family 2 protein, partial [Rikenellaceae bacterium]